MKSTTRIRIAPGAPATAAAAFVLALVVAAPLAAAGDDGASSPASWHADVEIDPTAYVLDGYSVHAGLARGRLRVDLGAFAIAVPELVHGNDGFDASFDGVGVKVQYFLFHPQLGGFVGVDAGVLRLLVQRRGTDLAVRDRQVTAGVDLGWRFAIAEGFYATAWLGLGYAFDADDITLDGATYEASPWVVFPAVHVGRRF